MARLNEPAPSMESIESLKRRFIRQNRDLARANSTQSLRIRSLENETSRLLAENLDLREQIIQFQNELENNSAQQIVDNTHATKAQLEGKLLELGALISSLGDEPVRKKAQTPKPRQSITRSPPQKDWRNMYNVSEISRGLEGSLPPILETKLYPRKTLELHELEAMLADDAADTTDSPEIGPPPVSQFVDQDPVKVDLAIRPRKIESDELLGLDPALSVNLEQRKKRKDSISGSDPRRISQTKPELEKDITNPLRTGAKRKMSVMDEEEREIPTKTAQSSPDDFKFTRVVGNDKSSSKTAVHAEKSNARETRELAPAKETVREKQSSATAPTSRTVLAAKSVNNSPKKSSKLTSSGAIKSIKPDDPNSKPVARPRARPRNDLKFEPAPTKATPETTAKTPKAQVVREDPPEPSVARPSSSQPSGRAESQKTPGPSDAGLSREEEARPSRRSRPSVSYAEPNLRAKMRRPTNEFVDAVAVGSQPDTVIKVEVPSPSMPATINAEAESDSQRKASSRTSSSPAETSPLKEKSATAGSLSNSITTHRKRRESILTESDAEFRDQGSTIAALLAEKRRARDKELEAKHGKGKAESVDIYEFRCSSPEYQERGPEKVKDAKPVSRSRRHTAGRDITYAEDSDPSDTETWKARRQMSVNRRGSTTTGGSAKEVGDGDKGLRKSTSATSIAGTTESRADRIAARRRSMML